MMLGMAMLTIVVSRTTRNAPRHRIASAAHVRRATRWGGAATTVSLLGTSIDRVKSSAIAIL